MNVWYKPHNITVATGGPSLLFQPIITSSRSGLYECDYNIHKSNSTYFSDMDISRTHLMTVLFSQGFKRLQKSPGAIIAPDGKPAKGPWLTMLGAVECNFKREIKPYEPYEIWTRVLTWDRKWLYIITHFVKKGAVKPAAYTMQSSSTPLVAVGENSSNKQVVPNGDAGLHQNGAAMLKVPHEAIFASAISKYVAKVGRLTIHPEVIMDASGVLPPRPGGWNTMSGTESPKNGEIELDSNTIGSATATETKRDTLDWRDIERERLRGMQLAEHFAALDGLHHEFTAEDKPALGVYSELF
jgi:Thioesterase-like superfamily